MPIPKLSVRVVRARIATPKNSPKQAVFDTTNEFSIDKGDIRIHRKEADILQAEFDKDVEPCRVYVCSDGIPVYAGMQWLNPSN